MINRDSTLPRIMMLMQDMDSWYAVLRHIIPHKYLKFKATIQSIALNLESNDLT